MNEVELRTALGRWFGYNLRWRWLLDDVLRTLRGDRHLAISAPQGAGIDGLANLLRASEGGTRVVVVNRSVARPSGPAIRALVRPAVRLVVIVEAPRAEALVPAALLPQGAAVARVPAICERREDLARLLAEARARAEIQLGLGRARIRPDLKILYSQAWHGHLDEIDRVVRRIVALRAAGSLRRASIALGTTKSTLSDQLRRIGVRVTPKEPGH